MELYLTIDKLVFGHPIGQRPLLLLGALAIIVGVQLLSLGLIGELIANSRARGGPDPAQLARIVEGGTAVQSVTAGESSSSAETPAPAAPAAGHVPADAAGAAAGVAPGVADSQ